jgi:hypothetical protein
MGSRVGESEADGKVEEKGEAREKCGENLQ